MRGQIIEMNHLSKMLLDAIALYLSTIKKEHAVVHILRQKSIDQWRDMINIIEDERQLYESIKPCIEAIPCRRGWWFWGEEKPSRIKNLMLNVLTVYQQSDELIHLRASSEKLHNELHTLKLDYKRDRKEWENVIVTLQQQWLREQRDCHASHQKEISALSQENAAMKRAITARLNQKTMNACDTNEPRVSVQKMT